MDTIKIYSNKVINMTPEEIFESIPDNYVAQEYNWGNPVSRETF